MSVPPFPFDLTVENLRHPASPDLYSHVFQADDLELCRLAGPGMLLRVVESDDISPKSEVEELSSDYALDPRRTASICIVRNQPNHGSSKKRRRAGGPEHGLQFPRDEAGTKINQGYGGDLSFLPTQDPVVCKQSCKFTCFQPDAAGQRSSGWEVR